EVGLAARNLRAGRVDLGFTAAAKRPITLFIRDRLFEALMCRRPGGCERLLTLALQRRTLHVRIGSSKPAPGVCQRRICSLDTRLRGSNLRLSRRNACLRLLYSGILQFFLPSIVDQRALTGLIRGF